MSFRKRLQRWWDELLGRPPWYRDSNDTAARSKTKPAQPPSPSPDGLSLADEAPNSRSGRRAGPRRTPGVDPYANDAGFTKPHAWEHVDHD